MSLQSEELCWMPAVQLAAAIKEKQVSPQEVIRATLSRIERLNPKLNAYYTVTADKALKEAERAEHAVMHRSASFGLLHGVPFSAKDMLLTKGVRTTFGSKIFADNIPEEDTPAVERLKKAGAILIGKTNTPEFGWLGVTQNRLFGVTRNPWNPELTSGGSSGGAAAAVAAGMGPLAIGSDGGGSIRIPASFCGVFGFKPTHGRIPVYPQGPNWSISHNGPMTRSVQDAALMMNVMAGQDNRDQFSLPDDGIDYVKALAGGLDGLRIAWSPTLGHAAVSREVEEICEKAILRFAEFGCTVEAKAPEWPNPHDIWLTLYYGGLAARITPFLAEYTHDLDPGLVAITEEVAQWPATKYITAWLARTEFYNQTREFFENYDLLLSPAVAIPAFKAGVEYPRGATKLEIGEWFQWLALSYPFNLTGQPAASVPCGFTKNGLPVGLQIVGRRFSDARVLKAAAALERIQPFTASRPPLDE